MSYETIRRNATKKIADLLGRALVISGYYYDEIEGTVYFTKSAADVMAGASEFTRVYARLNDAGEMIALEISSRGGRHLTAWMDKEAARTALVPSGFARLFPEDPQSIAWVAEQAAKKAAAEATEKTAAERRLADLEARPEPAAYAVGDRFVARFPSLNKLCTADEYRNQLARPEYDRGDRCAHWSDDLCVVEKVLHLSRGEFSHLCNNLLEDRTDLGQGGTGSDVPAPANLWSMSDSEREAWVAKSWRAVTVVTCDGCRPLVIDPQGYRYARYVGFYPTPVKAPKPLAQVIPFRTPATVH
mgnify:FL=1